MWLLPALLAADTTPAEVALIGFGGTVVTALAGIVAARLADNRHDDGSPLLDRILAELDELRRRIGVLERDRPRPRPRPRPRRRRSDARRPPA